MNFKKFISIILLQILGIGIFAGTISAQKKFEFGIRLDALTIPVNFGAFIEDGPGYYDIHTKGNIKQAAYLDFTYWPLPHWGISLGAGVHNFHSEIEYSIPDPSNYDPSDTVFYRHDQFKAVGLGPEIALQYRNDRFRARLGLIKYDFSKQEYPVRSSVTGISIINPPDVLADIQIEEESFWNGFFTGNDVWQFDVAYEVINNLFIKVGFESSLTSKKFYPYTTRISGFTYDTTPEDQLLNDFKMSNAYSAFSFGVEYVIGFGKYGKNKMENIEEK